mmetsp:Transcript_66282/g.194400  ORF Transcript_66282/g.194400 Transcript_66282/m.194400 type:complete len:243 (-) Transcript_66282:393-1121(-)
MRTISLTTSAPKWSMSAFSMPSSMVVPAAGQEVHAPRRPSITAPRSLVTPRTSMSPPSALSIGRSASKTASTFSTVSSLEIAVAPPARRPAPMAKGLEIIGASPEPGMTDSVSVVCPSITALQSSPSTAFRKRRRRSESESSSPSTSSARFWPIANCIFHLRSSRACLSSSESASSPPPRPSAAASASSGTPNSSAQDFRISSRRSRVHIRGRPSRIRTRAKRACPSLLPNRRARSAGTRRE